MRNEREANMALADRAERRGTQVPSWQRPAPKRPCPHRRTFGVLAIASRHGRLFAALVGTLTPR